MRGAALLRGALSSRWFFACYLVVAVLALGELAARVWFSVQIGPQVMLYGTAWHRNSFPSEGERRWRATLSDERFVRGFQQHERQESRPDSVERHGRELAGYTKFFPGESKSTRDAETGERIRVRINGQGLRGPDFAQAKPPGVVRVLTLGSSSTFGFYNRDDETYPHLLEELLNARCAGKRRFEVINFGVPHATSDQVAALFLAEGVPLAPDAVTFYDGRNDTVGTVVALGRAARLRAALSERSLLAAFVDRVLIGGGAPAGAGARLEEDAAVRGAIFLDSLERIREACDALGIRLVVANQQATAAAPYPRPRGERQTLRGVTYRQETDAIAARLAAGGEVDYYAYALLLHRRLMDDLRAWAVQRAVPFVDVIAALDRDRDQLVSWVHLTADANRVVATALAGELEREFCGGAGAAPAEPPPRGAR